MTDIRELTVQDIQKAYASGELSCLELTLRYLECIAAIDSDGLHAVLEINPDAIDIAESLDREYAQKGPRGPLHGIPVLIKDNIDTGDKMHTTAGSLALQNNIASQDAHIVKRLREAGAVILGKTNLTEFANFLTDDMRNGYSSRGGATLNPYGEGLDVGGSSAGSGAAVSANFCAVAVGTETSGSILCPANWNGVVGIKPTKGLVSRTGIIPICTAQDTAGPLARTVADAAALLTVLAGTDPADPATHAIEPYLCDFTRFLNPEGLKGKRIGVNTLATAKYPQEHQDLLPAALKAMEEAGAVLVPVEAKSCDGKMTMDILLYEFKACLNAYLAGCKDPGCRSLAQIIDYNAADPENCLKYGQTIALAAEKDTNGRMTEKEYLSSRVTVLRQARQTIDSLLREHQLDGLVQLGWGSLPPSSGYPAISVPIGVGRETGHPIGVTFFGTAFSEPSLIEMACAFEKRMGTRVLPPLD
ncbi:MAG: amidase [Oscillospiraceae bacterium]|nr:amidase [Oscillospiraceae bacterium]